VYIGMGRKYKKLHFSSGFLPPVKLKVLTFYLRTFLCFSFCSLTTSAVSNVTVAPYTSGLIPARTVTASGVSTLTAGSISLSMNVLP